MPFMKKFLFVNLILIFVSNFMIFGLSLEDLVGQKNADILRKKGTVSLVHPIEENQLSLVPSCAYSDLVKNSLVEKDEKNVPFVAEFLYLVPKSELLEGSTKTDVTVDDVSKVLRSISRMQGMRYNFDKKKNGEVLYKSTYMIESENSKVKIPDQIQGSADGKVFYCYQHDNSYGDINYVLNYRQNENTVYVNFSNTSPMSMLGLKAVSEGKLQLNVLSIDLGDQLLLYLSSDVDSISVFFFDVRKKMTESMTSRMKAIYLWFLQQFK